MSTNGHFFCNQFMWNHFANCYDGNNNVLQQVNEYKPAICFAALIEN